VIPIAAAEQISKVSRCFTLRSACSICYDARLMDLLREPDDLDFILTEFAIVFVEFRLLAEGKLPSA
jgi:hypothetical protein